MQLWISSIPTPAGQWIAVDENSTQPTLALSAEIDNNPDSGLTKPIGNATGLSGSAP